ncbi:MAG: GIY-YIG nuclease family protein [Rhodospirillaceae bacterium]|jgi:putative endonuclease|nr:GIY-YIG nuclease family protein [Rhodospirillaceae bacterium]MBT6087511.1 GIY-YIG nuclease family protein [Rhodospirillaceae bacterium]MBT6608454.1 GIY-YIG nuclease family protein [Rhodospirillaceae bacterium]MBT6883405.1 GIY-YIG nuclease family protein [Rhodospirillaceae bacterium]MBT7248114.1 GIY-YIG nuclease family protein [Rhodospirillaceae bacterium]
MPGLDPGIHVFVASENALIYYGGMSGAWVYIMTNRPDGTLYVGVTNNLARRVREHQEGVTDGFTRKHGLKRLVFAEAHDDIQSAIQREKNIKHWSRTWKVKLIHRTNPNWDDLSDRLT